MLSSACRGVSANATNEYSLVLLINDIDDPDLARCSVIEHLDTKDIAWRWRGGPFFDALDILDVTTFCSSSFRLTGRGLIQRRRGGRLPGHADRPSLRRKWARNSSLSVNPTSEPSAT